MKRIVKAGAVMAVATLMAIPVKGEWVNARSGLNVRSTPSTDAEIVAVLPFATEVTGTAKDGWMQIEGGYVSTEFLQDADPLADAEYLGTFHLTAYPSTGYQTASGKWPEVNVTVAHNSLPFGTELYIKGHGIWTVEDRGPASMGTEWCDLYLGDYNACVLFGSRYADVWILKKP